MKTKNNVQKAVLRTAAVVMSLVLISFTVNAQEFWKKLLTSSSFNEIALAMVETSKGTKPVAVPAENGTYLYEMAYEPEMELENWMVNESHFAVSGTEMMDFAIENEKPLQLESWMLNEGAFTTSQEGDNALSLENWMISSEYWNM